MRLGLPIMALSLGLLGAGGVQRAEDARDRGTTRPRVRGLSVSLRGCWRC